MNDAETGVDGVCPCRLLLRVPTAHLFRPEGDI